MAIKYSIRFTFKNVVNDRSVTFTNCSDRDTAFKDVTDLLVKGNNNVWVNNASVVILSEVVCVQKDNHYA